MDELKRMELEGDKAGQTKSFPEMEKELEQRAETPTTEGDDESGET